MLRSLLVLFLAAFAASLKVPVPGEQTGRRSALASAAALALLPAMKANAAPGATPIWGYNKKKITPPPGSWKYCDTLKPCAKGAGIQWDQEYQPFTKGATKRSFADKPRDNIFPPGKYK